MSTNNLKKIFRIVFPRKEKPRYEEIFKSGNLNIGNETDISKLNIHYIKFNPGYLNIEIGSDCKIEGTLALHSTLTKIKFGDRSYMGPNSTIFGYGEIIIGNDTLISWNCTIIDTNAHSMHSQIREKDISDWKYGLEVKDWSVVKNDTVIIGNNCWIGFNSIIMKGVELGNGCIVAAGSVVTKSFKPFSVIGGNPAEFIKETD